MASRLSNRPNPGWLAAPDLHSGYEYNDYGGGSVNMEIKNHSVCKKTTLFFFFFLKATDFPLTSWDIISHHPQWCSASICHFKWQTTSSEIKQESKSYSMNLNERKSQAGLKTSRCTSAERPRNIFSSPSHLKSTSRAQRDLYLCVSWQQWRSSFPSAQLWRLQLPGSCSQVDQVKLVQCVVFTPVFFVYLKCSLVQKAVSWPSN